MAGYIGTQAVSVNTTSATISDDLAVGDDALITGTLTTTAATVFNGGFAANDGSTITVDDNTANLTLTCTDADATVGPMQFFYRQSSSAATNDQIGTIFFTGRNAANNADVTYASIVTNIADVDNGGKLTFNVATHDGESQAGLILSDGNAEDEIDVTIGNGTSSLTSVAGNIDVTGTAQIDGTITSNGNLTISNASDPTINITDTTNTTILALRATDSNVLVRSTGNHPLVLNTNQTDRMTVETNGNVTIEDGNLVVASGHGIDFSATGGGTDTGGTNETLSDFETGTWTPKLKDVNGNEASGYTSGYPKGTYIKVGRHVWVNFSIRITNKGSMTGGYVFVANLPFDKDSTAEGRGTGTIDFFTNFAEDKSYLALDCSSTVNVLWLVGGRDTTTSHYVNPAQLDNDATFKGGANYVAT